MLTRIQLLSVSFASGLLLLFVLCLGSQNLNNRFKVNLVFATTEPLPAGFVVGLSVVLGVISGGSTATILLPPPKP